MPEVASLFAGIGGIDLGFIQAGFRIVWANEIDAAACKTYRHNLGAEHLIEGDIRDIPVGSIPKVDVLVAGFPCQSFSIGGRERGFSDSRGQLFFEIIRVAATIMPKVIFLENVENLMEHDEGKTFQVVYSSLVELGYYLHYRPMPSHEYANIPQTRRRIYLVATNDLRFSRMFTFPEPIPLTVTANDWINRDAKQPELYYIQGNTLFEKKTLSIVSSKEYIYRAYHGSIKAMHNMKCPTLTASMHRLQGAIMVKDNYGVRRLTLRECLRFQGFPPDFYFPKTVSMEDAYKQIGNSVTVPVVKRIAEAILSAMQDGKKLPETC